MPAPLDEAQAHLAARRPAEAARLLEPLAAGSGDPELHHLLGNAYVGLDRAVDAERSFRRAVALSPTFRKSWNNLGILAGARGDVADALACYDRAIALEPTAAAHLNRGLLYEKSGRAPEALDDYEAGVRLAPAHAKLRAQLGVALSRTQRWRDALPHLREALARGEGTRVVRTKLVEALAQCGDARGAAELAERWVGEQPADGRAHRSLGVALARIDTGRALHHLTEATRLEPSDAGGWAALGGALSEAGRVLDAEAAFERSLALRQNGSVANDLAVVRGKLRRPDEALALLDQVVASGAPVAPQADSNRLLSLCYAARPPREVFEAHVAWGRRWAGEGLAAPRPVRGHARVRVGYLSPDLRSHSVAHFLAPILRAHDRARFEVFAYADGDVDEVSTSLAERVDHFRHVKGATDDALAAAIADDELDVLIELAGHTGANRQRMLARRRLATLTATYLGYPNTTGNPGIDVRIGDAVVDGPEAAPLSLCSEALWSMAAPMWRYAPPPQAPAAAARPGRPLTFGCFNNYQKLSPQVLSLWARVLRATPGSRLLVKTGPLRDAAVAAAFRAELAALGVEPHRVELRGWAESTRAHLDAYNEVDVALDSFPYHGTTTTVEALWMGVPVVTLAGDAHVSRVGVSLLRAIGRDAWCADTPDAYVARAVELSRALPDRQALRAAVEASPLCAPDDFVRELETRIVGWLAAHGRACSPRPSPGAAVRGT